MSYTQRRKGKSSNSPSQETHSFSPQAKLPNGDTHTEIENVKCTRSQQLQTASEFSAKEEEPPKFVESTLAVVQSEDSRECVVHVDRVKTKFVGNRGRSVASGSNSTKCERRQIEQTMACSNRCLFKRETTTSSNDSTYSDSSYARRKKYFQYRNERPSSHKRRSMTRQCRFLNSIRRRRSRRLRMRKCNSDHPPDRNVVATPVRPDHLVQSASVYKAIKKLEKVDESKRPSELIRRDFISAMKLPDRHILTPGEYWTLKDRWRATWDRGVHVPVGTISAQEMYRCYKIPANVQPTKFNVISSYSSNVDSTAPRPDDKSTVIAHPVPSTSRAMALVTCLYDVDAIDLAWLNYIRESGIDYRQEDFERCMIAFEFCCAEQMRQRISECLTFDRNVVCDVCRSPEASDGDEMVFCDGCDVCVHQSCYGIRQVPQGEWLCGPCSKGFRTGSVQCILCGFSGGAMKPVIAEAIGCSPSIKWCHLCCALWIPETTIGDLDTMEPIVGIDRIPAARWSLLCYLCRVRLGACVQCSLPSCRKAFHVTCALQHNLRIDTTSKRHYSGGSNKNGGNCPHYRIRRTEAVFVAYCDQHSGSPKSHPQKPSTNVSLISSNNESSATQACVEMKRSNKCQQQSPTITRRRRLTPQKIARNFYRLVDANRIALHLRADVNLVTYTYHYWVDKRKRNHNLPLIDGFPTSKSLDNAFYVALHDYLGIEINSNVHKLNLIYLRQQLELARNLCYMVLKRERLKRQSALLALSQIKLLSEVSSAQKASPDKVVTDSSPSKNDTSRKEEAGCTTNCKVKKRRSGLAYARRKKGLVAHSKNVIGDQRGSFSSKSSTTDNTPEKPRGRPRKLSKLMYAVFPKDLRKGRRKLGKRKRPKK